MIARDQTALQTINLALQSQLINYASLGRFFMQLPALDSYVRRPGRKQLEDVAERFVAFSRVSGHIKQLRLLNPAGEEILRFDRTSSGLVRVPDAALQDKSTRPYYRQASSLGEGEWLVSPIELNVERGEIEQPHSPVIRVAAPLFDDAHSLRAILVINFEAATLLQQVDALYGAVGTVQVLNNEGYWLKASDPEQEWGFMLGHGATLADQAPAVWYRLMQAPQGSLQEGGRYWSWLQIAPFDSFPMGVSEQSPDSRSDAPVSTARWYLLINRPQPAVLASVWREHRYIASLYAVLLLISFAQSYRLARTQRNEARLNAQLVEQVRIAEEAAEVKGRFLANMSHEIRTPMNAVLGIAYLLEKQMLPRDARNLVRKLSLSGKLLLGIINDILDFSKFEHGSFELASEPFQLSKLLESISSAMASLALEKDIDLAVAAPEESIDWLLGDGLRLEQVLMNLVSNAIKFTDEGHVDLSVRVLSSQGKRVRLEFTVRDTGIGIPQEQQKQLFQPFTQLDSSSARRFGGTGLGLAISQYLVGRMGGQIRLRSDVGAGTEASFTVEFERRDDIATFFSDLRALEMLIVDDNMVSLEALCATARNLGWRPVPAASGEEALQILALRSAEGTHFRVVIVDSNMPAMDGLATAQAIRSQVDSDDNTNTIILLATPHSMEQMDGTARLPFVNGVLRKPVSPSALYEAVVSAAFSHEGTPHDRVGVSLARLAGLRVLVVDDSETNREVARRIFEGEGALVHLANNGQQAVTWLEAHHVEVDLVLMDVQMPVMDGYAATRVIRAHADPQLAGLPVIALTAGAFQSQQDQAKACGMTDYIAKPLDVDAAIARLAQYRPRDASVAEAADVTEGAPQPAAQSNVLDVQAGLRIWRDEAVYSRYLHKFARDFSGVAGTLAALDAEAAKALLHRLRGAASNLGVVKLARCARELEECMVSGDDCAPLVNRLRAAMSETEAAIASHVGHVSRVTSATENAATERSYHGLCSLLRELLQALSLDDPAAVEPLLDELGGHVPELALTPVRVAVENFDFRQAERSVTLLLETYSDEPRK